MGIIFIALSTLLELTTYYTFLWRFRKIMAIATLIVLGFGVGCIVESVEWFFATILAILCTFRGFSLLRLIEGRTSPERLHTVGRQTFWWLSFGILLCVLAVLFASIPYSLLATIIAIGSIMLGAFFAIGTALNLHSSRPNTGSPLADKELPTVTIAIPARNETDSLADCLEAALASDYPKLEILVLDDCSQDKTAEVIKSFAHDGVRFVLGKPAPEDWLAKNYSYQQLLDEAAGEYVLFMGVDIRLHTTSVRSLVQALRQNQQTMVSVLPRRTRIGLAAAFVQPMRYWWELAIPPQVKKWPPVLSSCWMIDRKTAVKDGGFNAVKRAILPERHFARDLGANYAFVRTSLDSLITTHKDFASQWSTAIRTRYPQLHRRPELVAFQTIVFSLFVLAPFIVMFTAPNMLVAAACFVAVVLYSATHVAITYVTNREALWLAPFNIFFAFILDVISLNTSMYMYEFKEVYWKGRNVCVPVMRVIPKLPKI